MKDKIVKWKDQIVAKMAENKKLSAICITAAIVAVLVIVVAVAGLGGGSQSGKSNDAQLKNDQTVETDKKKTDSTEKQTEKDKKTEEKSTTGKDKKDAVKSDGTTGETTAQAGGEQQTTKAGVAGGTVDQSSTKSQNGGSNNNAGNSNANTGNTNSSNLNAGNTNAGSSNANTGNTNTGNTGNSAGGNRNSGNTNSGNVNTGNANAGTANQGGNQTAGGSSGNTSQNQGGSTNQNTGSGNQGSNTAVHSGTDSVQPNEENIYNQLFDINNKVTISLDISEAELRKLQADYKQYGNGKSPIYRRVTKMTVTINNTSYDMYDVGVRMKGNTSRCDVFNNGDVNNRNMIHLKLSFDEAFDEKDYYGAEALQWSEGDRKERKGRTFATLDGLELKWNRNFDSTYVTNVYANQMYRALGVYAQNTSLANVRFAGYNYGVYTIYEPVGKKFLKRYMGNAKDGDLYKCGWSNVGASYTKNTLSSIGIETPYRSLTYDLKTNKSTSNHESLKNLINQMNNSPSKETFASLVDVDQWVMFAAVSYFIGNPDDLRNNYNNHYVYFKNGKAVFIPYDYDRCFGIGTEKKEDMTAYSPYADNTALQGGQSNPIYLRSITGRSNQYTTEYTNALKKVAESGWINYSNYLNYYNAARNNYASVAIPDGNVHIYVKPFGSSSGRNYDTSALGFAESNSTNASVSTYFTKIMESYRTAMAKWN